MRQRSREFLEDLYWISFAVVLLFLALSLIQLSGIL